MEIDQHLPFVLGPRDAKTDDWGITVPALVVRIRDLVASALTLMDLRRNADASLLLRAAFEHCATFAWVALKPDERVAKWQAEEFRTRLLASDLLAAHGFAPPFTGDERNEWERYVFQHVKKLKSRIMPTLREQCEVVDQRLDELNLTDPSRDAPDHYFLHGYARFYTEGSALTHPTSYGLLGNIVDMYDGEGLGNLVVEREGLGQHGSALLGIAPRILWLTLKVASAVREVPLAKNEVDGMLERVERRVHGSPPSSTDSASADP